MDPIVWDIRHGLPNQKYMQYVYHYILASRGKLIDPFALDTLSKVSEIYVPRSDVESEITQPGNRIVFSQEGGGKTTLARFLSSKATHQTLIVNLSLPEAKKWFSKGEEPEADSYSWTLPHLISRIFAAYWNQVIATPKKRGVYLPFLRSDREWMLKLRWFFRQYPPDNYLMIDDFELLTWLTSAIPHEPFGPQIRPQDVFTALIDFITVPFDLRKILSTVSFSWPYTKVRLIMDHTEGVTNFAISQLAHSIQALHELSLSGFEFCIFVNSKWEGQLTALPCIKSGYVSVYKLPQWDAQQLQGILDKRVIAHRDEFTDYETGVTNLGINRSGIPSGLLNQIKYVLTRCEPFSSDRDLRAVFVDERLSRWQTALPEARSVDERVKSTIDYLNDKFHSQQNALVLLLQTLSDSFHTYDNLHQRLRSLAAELSTLKSPSSTEQVIVSAEQTQDWVQLLTGLNPAVKYHFRRIITEGALRAYTQPTEFDAPIHALKLVRGLIAACAGCWPEHFPPPLNAHQLQEIVDLYWEEEKCDD